MSTTKGTKSTKSTKRDERLQCLKPSYGPLVLQGILVVLVPFVVDKKALAPEWCASRSPPKGRVSALITDAQSGLAFHVIADYQTAMHDTLLDFPTCRSARLVLRPLGAADTGAFQEMTDDPAITGPIHFLPAPFTWDDANRLIHGNGDGRDGFIGAWTIDGAEMVAVVGLHLHGDDEVEIGYWVRSSRHGQGFAAEAAAQVISVAQRHFPTRRVMAECRDENLASRRLLEKLGFRATGTAGRRPGRQRYLLL